MKIMNQEDPAGKIDDLATNGLAGVNNSLAYRVHEIERHLHSHETWFETAAIQDPGLHEADRLGDGGGAFQVTSGNTVWGEWLQILGTTDTPHLGSSPKFDFNTFFIEDVQKAGTFFIQFGFGATGAAALEAGNITETAYVGTIGAGNPLPIHIQSRRITAGTKAWVRIKTPLVNVSTMDIYFGLHEYEG